MSSWKFGRSVAMAAVAAGGFLALFTGSAAAQNGALRVIAGRSDAAGSALGVQPPMNRALNRGMQRAKASIAAGEYSQAIRFLDEVLGMDEDGFVEVGDDGALAGTKQVARRLIRDLPAEGRLSYETSFGATAQRLLEEAIVKGDPQRLATVAHRYFYTPAGYEAALLLAMDEADAGRHFSAALAYDQLLEAPEAVRRFEPALSIRGASSWLAAGEEAKAREILDRLLAQTGQSAEIAGRVRKLEKQADSTDWLRDVVGQPNGLVAQQERQWLTYRGNAARNGSVSGGLPHLRVRWEVPLLGSPKLETLFENLIDNFVRSGQLVPIASNVIAAGEYILTRTPQGLLAVDFKTGKRIWRSEPQREEVLEKILQSASNGEDQASNPEPVRAFVRRLWEDYLYGVISSDGERVYMVNNLAMPLTQQYEFAPFMGGDLPERGATNKLTAYELATQGKLLWEIDGEQTDGNVGGMFFLGAPLTVGQSLYILGESQSAIYLLALNREDGSLEWRQQLASLEASVQLDLRRRLQSMAPSYDAGVIVCPTGAGVVMGVDLAKRSFAWAYRFDSASLADNFNRGRDDLSQAGLSQRWTENAVAIADGKVVLTPPESEYLHCVELQSGKLLWKIKRDDMTRLACIEDGRVLLIGNRKLKAVNLSDGKPAWKNATLGLASGVLPAGTGFASDGKYFLPLTSAEVISVDLAEGRIVGRTAPRDGAPLGNLICHRGSVISQNGEYLDCYDQIESLRKRSERLLEAEPNNVDALRTLGEVAFNEERLSDAIALLERAYRADPEDVETRDVLAECLAAALDGDFNAHRDHLPLLKELNDGGMARQMLICRIEAQGMLESGNRLAAADACFKLYRLAEDPEELLAIGRDHRTAISRWVAGQLAAVWSEATAEERQSLLGLIEREIAGLGPEPRGESLARFLAFFGELPPTSSLRLLRARELALAGQSLESQQLLLDLASAADPAVRREAIGRIAWQLHEAGLHALAYEYDAELAGPLADEIVFDDVTGQALVDQWKGANDGDPTNWPGGRVRVELRPATPAMGARMRMAALPIRIERSDSILGLSNAQIGMRGGEVTLSDNFGREFFRANAEADNHGVYRQAGSVYGVSRGNLFVVSLGRQVVALNTLSATDALAPTVLWRANLVTNLSYDQTFASAMTGGDRARPGTLRATRPIDEEQKLIGVIGPVTSRGVVFQDQRRLLCLDATSGEIRWSRTDVPQGCELFGDDELAFAWDPAEPEAAVYSAIDGRFLGRRAVPPFREQVVAAGRRLICWKVVGARAELSSFDAWTGETAWKKTFESGAAIDVDLGRYIAVADSSGQVTIVDGETGATLVDYRLPEAQRVDELHLRVGRDEFLLLAPGPQTMNRGQIVQGFPLQDAPVMSGSVMLFSRFDGSMRWPRPAEVERQAYPLNQPIDLPFIMFAGQLHRDNSGSRPISTVFALDKSTGRTILRADDLPPNNGGQCVARISDAEQHQATIEMSGKTILLQFTDEARPPEPPSLAEVEVEAKSGWDGVIGILLKSLDGN
jgi:outer membrane protein assembly factor BamB